MDTISNNAYSHPLVCYHAGPQPTDGFVKRILEVFVTILRVKSTDANYFLKDEEVFTFTAKGIKKVQLGWDRRTLSWYTDHKTSWVMNDFLKKFPSLTGKELNNMDNATRSSIEPFLVRAPQFLRSLVFSPPLFECQYEHSKAFALAERKVTAIPVKNVAGITINNLKQLFTDLLKVNKGVFVGVDYAQLETNVSRLTEQMETLKQANVKHIYLGTPATLYPQFEDYNLNPNASEEDLLTALKETEKGSGAVTISLCREAKKQGIQVWPVDSNCSTEVLTERLKYSAGSMVRNIDCLSARLNPEEKYVAILGQVYPQVARELGLPNVQFGQNSLSSMTGDEGADDFMAHLFRQAVLLDKPAQESSVSFQNYLYSLQLSSAQRREIQEAPDFVISA